MHQVNRSSNPDESTLKNKLVSELAVSSYNLIKEIGFTDDELSELFGSESLISNEDEYVGTALIIYHLQIDNWNGIKSEVNEYEMPLAVACFLESTGVAAGLGLLGALTGQLGGKALRKAFIKAAKKIGTRFLGGIGLALVAVEFAWCMTR